MKTQTSLQKKFPILCSKFSVYLIHDFSQKLPGIFLLLFLPMWLQSQSGPNQGEDSQHLTSEMEVVFPQHYCSGTVGGLEELVPEKLPEGFGKPIIRLAFCDNTVIRHRDEVTALSGNNQIRIIRRWEVCDPCHKAQCKQGVQIIQSKIDPNVTPLEERNSNLEKNNFALFQNRPNPFSNETVIGFTLPEEGAITLSIHQSDGRVLHVVKGDYPNGKSEVLIKASVLPSDGILFYTLTTENHKATKQMVKMK